MTLLWYYKKTAITFNHLKSWSLNTNATLIRVKQIIPEDLLSPLPTLMYPKSQERKKTHVSVEILF